MEHELFLIQNIWKSFLADVNSVIYSFGVMGVFVAFTEIIFNYEHGTKHYVDITTPSINVVVAFFVVPIIFTLIKLIVAAIKRKNSYYI